VIHRMPSEDWETDVPAVLREPDPDHVGKPVAGHTVCIKAGHTGCMKVVPPFADTRLRWAPLSSDGDAVARDDSHSVKSAATATPGVATNSRFFQNVSSLRIFTDG